MTKLLELLQVMENEETIYGERGERERGGGEAFLACPHPAAPPRLRLQFPANPWQPPGHRPHHQGWGRRGGSVGPALTKGKVDSRLLTHAHAPLEARVFI